MFSYSEITLPELLLEEFCFKMGKNIKYRKCIASSRMVIDEWRCRTWWSSHWQAWTWHPTWWREARVAGVSRPTGHHGDGLMGWAVIQRTTFMTCMQCVTIMGQCRVDITQVTEHYKLDKTTWLYCFSCCRNRFPEGLFNKLNILRYYLL